MHPLATVAEQIECTGYEMQWNSSQFDTFGNPQFDKSKPIKINLMMKSAGTIANPSKVGGEVLTQLVKCYIVGTDNNEEFTMDDLIKLAPIIDISDGRQLQIIDKQQRLLKPINKVFGLQFKAMLISNVV